MPSVYNYPVWGTQGGGLVREVSKDVYIFVEKPDCPGLDVGDTMPAEWGIIAGNELASQEILREEQEGMPAVGFAAEVLLGMLSRGKEVHHGNQQ